jgi:cytoskeletal protein RodZ
MMKEQKSRLSSSIFLAALLMVATLLLSTAESFSPSPNKTFRQSQLSTPPPTPATTTTTPTSTTTLFQQTVFPQDSKVGTPGQPNLPEWVNLPNRVSRKAVTSTLFTTEIQIGRLAMVGAVGLILKEFVTGESVLEQISDIATTLHF